MDGTLIESLRYGKRKYSNNQMNADPKECRRVLNIPAKG
jgi:hypothetical protein